MKKLYIGLMSGTSMDAVDAVLVDFSSNHPMLLSTSQSPLPPALRKALVKFYTTRSINIIKFAELDQKIALISVDVVKKLLEKSHHTAHAILAIGSHGQTVFHYPRGSNYPFTLQIGDPNIIAEKTGITTIADFRRRDIAAGGQGAPLTPAFHNLLFRTKKEDTLVLNLGGIANITYLPADQKKEILGFDTGPANCLLDQWIQFHLKRWFDEEGAWAASAAFDPTLLNQFLSDPYFQLKPPKSTGPEYFNLNWIRSHFTSLAQPLTPAIVQATLCELVARHVAHAIQRLKSKAGVILLCGGGSKNTFLKKRLQHHCYPHRLYLTDEKGISSDWLEAMAFAWIAKQTLEGKISNLPEVTGAQKGVILGGIYLKN
ncbi:anhydro-N-acetylmuramic acid kinase [Rickettsiella grylli]|uniref:Anhydro-N-acetylmuramic acid kinase n=1 Tax=Rickettsiella grylli TaxID=59196 RepID=A8PN57_9COXI|nr:anhydro-N-acetylmuramic acid kinase [Rickettsiella grylli]EDP45733.1 anhydro-N-acetylmuramic acid kinase (AnhMurNAc kinase) [Rickettsiella grylli]